MRSITIIHLLSILLLLFTQATTARMYQWTEPDTGTTQLSGKPPIWYRSNKGGPRTMVFENGRLIDDTSVELSDKERRLVRQSAFVLAEENRQQVKEKIAKSRDLTKHHKKLEPRLNALEESGAATDSVNDP